MKKDLLKLLFTPLKNSNLLSKKHAVQHVLLFTLPIIPYLSYTSMGELFAEYEKHQEIEDTWLTLPGHIKGGEILYVNTPADLRREGYPKKSYTISFNFETKMGNSVLNYNQGFFIKPYFKEKQEAFEYMQNLSSELKKGRLHWEKVEKEKTLTFEEDNHLETFKAEYKRVKKILNESPGLNHITQSLDKIEEGETVHVDESILNELEDTLLFYGSSTDIISQLKNIGNKEDHHDTDINESLPILVKRTPKQVGTALIYNYIKKEPLNADHLGTRSERMNSHYIRYFGSGALAIIAAFFSIKKVKYFAAAIWLPMNYLGFPYYFKSHAMRMLNEELKIQSCTKTTIKQNL